MVVVGAFPNAAGAKDQDAKDPHQCRGQPGMRQYGLVLLVVIKDEEPEIKQPGQEAAH